MIRRAFKRRPAAAGLLALALVALAVGVAQALAAAGTATSPIEKDNFCGGDPGTSVIGTVTLTRLSNTTLREHVRLTKASPSTNYKVILQNGECTDGKTIGFLQTNSRG